jgi:3'-5' exoribonuclease
MGFNVDKDLVVAGTLLHDIGKSWSYSYDENGKPSYNEQAALLHHIPMGTIYISKAIDKWNEFADPALRINTALANNLLHIILSHHGRRAWSSPVIPQFVEAYIVHAVEMMDGKVEYYLTQGAPETLYD